MKLKDTCSLKAILNIDSTLKIKDITFLTKVCLVKAMVFLVVTCGCEIWTIKKAECRRIDALMLLNCGVGDDLCDPLGLHQDQTSPS